MSLDTIEILVYFDIWTYSITLQEFIISNFIYSELSNIYVVECDADLGKTYEKERDLQNHIIFLFQIAFPQFK